MPTEHEPLPSDILCAMLVGAETVLERKYKMEYLFRLHRDELQCLFEKLAEKYDVLKCFILSDSGYSSALQKSLIRLVVSGFIKRPDPQHPDLFTITNSAKEYCGREDLRLLPEEQKQIERIAEELAAIIPHVPIANLIL